MIWAISYGQYDMAHINSMNSNFQRLLQTENATFGDMFFDPNQKENIAEQLGCYSSINVGVNTVVPYSTAFDWLNPNLKIYNNFYQFRKNEFTFPAPSKKIRIPPAFQPIKKEPSPEININHVPKEKCDWKYETVAFVKTRPGNFEHRELMRQMVAKTKENWKMKEK